MSINVLSTADFEKVSESFLKLIAAEEKKSKADIKTYLTKTNLSTEEKTKRYAEFSSNLFNTKIQAILGTTKEFLVSDAQLYQQKNLNDAQIELNTEQIKLTKEETLATIEKVSLVKEQTLQTEKEKEATETKTWLAVAESKVNLDNKVSSSLSEARRNGADVVSVNKTFTDPSTNQSISYQDLKFTAASSSDTVKGLLGKQMKLAEQQGISFSKHTEVQVMQQISNVLSTALDTDATNIGGLSSAIKQIGEAAIGYPLTQTITDLSTSS